MKKITKFVSLLSALVMTAACMPFTACGNGDDNGGGSTYTIKFNENGGAEVQDITYEANATVSLPIPVKEGYSFAGWFTNENCVGNAEFTVSGKTGDIEYWAKWVLATYKITYKDGNKTLKAETGWLEEYMAADAESTSLALPATATKEGYTFAGWYDNEALTGNKVTAVPQGSKEDKTYYSAWTEIEYTITYVTNADLTIEDEHYTVSQSHTLKKPDDLQYLQFLGWHETQDFSDKAVTQIRKGETGNKTFYAEWKGEEFNITYNLDGGSFNGTYPAKYEYGKDLTLVSPVKEGYVFAGWYDNAAGTGNRVSRIQAGTQGGVTLYAKYIQADYSIAYELNGGSFTGDFLQGYNNGDTSEIVAPEKAWFEFKGWYDNADFTGSPVTSVAGKSANLTLYAKWEEATYKLNLETYGGTLTGAEITYKQGEKITQSLTTSAYKPTKAGYKFEGWYNNPDFLGDQIKSFSVDGTKPGSVNLYAKYSLETYTLTYVYNNGSNNTKVNYTIEDEVKLLTTTPTRTGHTFAGWYSDTGFTTPATDLPAGTTGNKSLYAKWTVNTYTITYELDGGTNPADAATSYLYCDFDGNKHRYADDQITWLPVPTKAGKVFGGWYEEQVTEPDAKKVKGAVLVGEEGNKTYYALWLDGELSTANSLKMEAEHTNLTGKTGPGYSGSGAQDGMIGYQTGASNGQCITYTHGPNVFIEWEFSLDREVKGATVAISLGSEIGKTQKFDNSIMDIRINGVVYSTPWSIDVPDTQNGEAFVILNISGIDLRAGFNVITLETTAPIDDTNPNGIGPAFDAITVTAKANINFEPIIWKK